MAKNPTTKKAKAKAIGFTNYTGQGRTATEVELPKLNAKAKQIIISFEMGKNDVKAEGDFTVAAHMECKRTKAKQTLKPWADANGYSMAEYGKLNVIVLTKS